MKIKGSAIEIAFVINSKDKHSTPLLKHIDKMIKIKVNLH